MNRLAYGPQVARSIVLWPLRGGFWVVNTVIFTAILQIGLLLPMVESFHRVSLVGIGLNAVAIPVLALALARERGIPIRRRIAGERFDRGGVRIRVLWPQEQESGEDESLILRLEWEDTGFFFRAIFEGRSRGGYLRSSNRSLWRF